VSEPIADRNPLVQRVRRLVRQRSERRAEGVYVVEGPQLVDEALAAGRDVEVIVVPESAASGPTARAAGHHGVRCVVVADRVFDSLSSTRSAQPALAVVADHDVALADLPADTLLVLAELADPGNVGTLVRSAEAFGVSGVVFAGGVDPYNPKVVRATAGSLFRMPHARLDGDHAPVAALAALGAAGFSRWAAVARGGEPPESIAVDGPVALVLGSEPHGLSAEVLGSCDGRVEVPTGGDVESLNVAVAGSVAMYVLSRR